MEASWNTKKNPQQQEISFVSNFIKELMKALRTKRMLSMAYHPQIDRQTDRINQEIGIFL